ncbi:phage portal protein [Granulicella mallensis]|uniref:HK97 family phage portal protein n=1 Tax=Granulicella mallensis TaxID=940614 RepID=A0A7W8EBT3_9BACT|nr:phage portal protein [Granulicella mallensis]MBB5066152.1 HK97 family phage portal protein [Granulicella mallensis]
MTGSNATNSGEAINHDTAMRIVTVYACIRVLSQAVASLPLSIYEKTKNGSREADSHPLQYLLSTEPNVEMDRHAFWSAIVTGLLITGNAYVRIVRNAAGQVSELFPLMPTITEPYRLPNGTLAYRTQQGQSNGTWKTLDADSVCHFRLLSMDGIKGLSPIQQAREALGLSRAAEKAGAKLFGNGARPGGLLMAPTGLNPEQKESAKKSWEMNHGGSNQGGTAVLSGDWKYQPLALSPEDSQFIQTRAMQRTEICALYGVPPNMAGDTTRLSNNNHEQSSLDFITNTLRPLLSILEGELNRKLVPQIGRKAGAYFIAFDITERLRGDFATQMQGFALGKQNGWYSSNDIRRKLGENTIDDPSADVYTTAVNMANSDQLIAQAKTENIDEQPLNPPNQDDNEPQTNY